MSLFPQTHDSFFKASFSQKKVAREYIETFVAAAVVARLNLDGMELDNNSYIDEPLRPYYSDLVWNIPYRNGRTTIKVALLFEHKTTPAKYIHLQLLRYMLAIWTKSIEAKEELVPIIPIVIYQSRKQWKKREFATLFKGIDPELLRYLPSFDYERTDITPEAEALLAAAERFRAMIVFKAMIQVAFKLLSHEHLQPLFSLADTLLGTGKELGDPDRELQVYILSYIFAHSDVSPETVREDVRNASLNSNEIMSTLEQFKVEGKAEGRAEGKAETMAIAMKIAKLHQKGYAPTIIATTLNVTLEEVNKAIESYENA